MQFRYFFENFVRINLLLDLMIFSPIVKSASFPITQAAQCGQNNTKTRLKTTVQQYNIESNGKQNITQYVVDIKLIVYGLYTK